MVGADRTALVRPLLGVVTADQLWTDHLVEYHRAVLEYTDRNSKVYWEGKSGLRMTNDGEMRNPKHAMNSMTEKDNIGKRKLTPTYKSCHEQNFMALTSR